MKIFIAGATGVIGRALVPRLTAGGHTVTAMTRDAGRAEGLTSQGAEPVICDVYDAGRLAQVVRAAAPEVVIHQLTALPAAIDPSQLEEQLAANDRIRVEGTRNLVRAAVAAGARRFVAQSISFVCSPVGGSVKNEDDPLWLDAPWPWRRTVGATDELERQVLAADFEGVVLRYGYFYGSGSAYARDGSVADLVRDGQMPIIGAGSGVFSFIHVDDAAIATIAALAGGASGVYNIVDDEPSPVSEWLPLYAAALGAAMPARVTEEEALPILGDHGIYHMTRQRGASNAKARRELAFEPRFASWRSGFAADLGAAVDAAPSGPAIPTAALP